MVQPSGSIYNLVAFSVVKYIKCKITFFSFAYIVSNYSTKEIQSVFVVCVKYNMKISPEYTFDDQDVD